MNLGYKARYTSLPEANMDYIYPKYLSASGLLLP